MLKSVADPFACLETMEKYSHHFEEKQRVRIKADKRCGTIESFNARQNANVKLDSGHLVQCNPDELEPEDWNSGESFDGKKVRGLIAAIEAGAVSAFDLNLLKQSSENTAVRRGLRDPLDFEGADNSTLRVMCEKYGDTETLSKRASEFRVGQEVIEKYVMRRARITNVGRFGSLDLDYGGGTTGRVLCSSVVPA